MYEIGGRKPGETKTEIVLLKIITLLVLATTEHLIHLTVLNIRIASFNKLLVS